MSKLTDDNILAVELNAESRDIYMLHLGHRGVHHEFLFDDTEPHPSGTIVKKVFTNADELMISFNYNDPIDFLYALRDDEQLREMLEECTEVADNASN